MPAPAYKDEGMSAYSFVDVALITHNGNLNIPDTFVLNLDPKGCAVLDESIAANDVRAYRARGEDGSLEYFKAKARRMADGSIHLDVIE